MSTPLYLSEFRTIVEIPFIRTKGPKKQCFLPPILWVSTAEARRSDQKFEKNSSYLIFLREGICVLYLKKKMDFKQVLHAKG